MSESKRRDVLREYMEEEVVYIATVQYASYRDKTMILNDVFTPGEHGERIKVAEHMWVFNVNDKKLKKMKMLSVILFKATACKYTKVTHDGDVMNNFAVENVRDIKIIRSDYNGK